MRMLRLPTARPLALRFPSNEGYLLDSSLFRSPRVSGVPPAAPGRSSTGLATPLPVLLSWRKPVGSLMFPENPFVRLPCSQTPSDLHAKPVAALRCCPRCQTTKAPALTIISRLNHTAFAPLHTLRATIADDYAMFASGWWLAFAGWACTPLSLYCVSEFVFFPFTSSSSHSGFHDAT